MPAMMLYNGTIYTMNPALPRAQALGIRNGRVVAIGTEGKVQAAMGGRVEPLNLRGRAVIPALTDAHVHLIWYALGRRGVRLDDADSVEGAAAKAAAAAARLPSAAWLTGGGWNHSHWGERWPVAADLDLLIPDRPVLLMRKDGHSAWVNQRALAIAGIDANTPDPPGGSIQRNAGRVTGMLFERAVDLVRQHIPPPTQEERLAAIRDVIAEAHSYGMVGMHLPPALQPGDGAQTLRDLQQLRAQDQLRLRCLVHLGLDALDEAIAVGLQSGFGDRWIKIGGVKMFADGSLGSETAEMLTPYRGRSHFGIATMSTVDLNDAVQRAIANNISVTIHAIGDGANRRVLNAIEAALAQRSTSEHAQVQPAIPNRIEHAQVLDERDLPRFAQLGVLASMQPIHATSDMDVAEQLWGQRCQLAYAWRSLKQAGAVLAFGSDAPVEVLNPWLGIHAAVTRQRTNGTPAQGWWPEQRLTVEEAIHGFSAGAAYAAGAAHEQGMLATGMLADLAVLSHDPFKIDSGALHGIQADLTILEGELVWERK